MTIKDKNGSTYVSLRWATGVLTLALLSAIGGWASQRHSVEEGLSNRIAAVEKIQARVLERLDSNHDQLAKIYQELREHRAAEAAAPGRAGMRGRQ
jgi:hypothetical protein